MIRDKPTETIKEAAPQHIKVPKASKDIMQCSSNLDWNGLSVEQSKQRAEQKEVGPLPLLHKLSQRQGACPSQSGEGCG